MARPKQYPDDSLHKYDFLIRERDNQDHALIARLDTLKAEGALSAWIRDALADHLRHEQATVPDVIYAPIDET